MSGSSGRSRRIAGSSSEPASATNRPASFASLMHRASPGGSNSVRRDLSQVSKRMPGQSPIAVGLVDHRRRIRRPGRLPVEVDDGDPARTVPGFDELARSNRVAKITPALAPESVPRRPARPCGSRSRSSSSRGSGCVRKPSSRVSSPSATLTIIDRRDGLPDPAPDGAGAIPSDPRDGSLTSMIAAPPTRAARASASDRTLTSNLATTRPAAEGSSDLAQLGRIRLARRSRRTTLATPAPPPARTRVPGRRARTCRAGRPPTVFAVERDGLDVAVDQARPGHGIELPFRPGREVGRDEEQRRGQQRQSRQHPGPNLRAPGDQPSQVVAARVP